MFIDKKHDLDGKVVSISINLFSNFIKKYKIVKRLVECFNSNIFLIEDSNNKKFVCKKISNLNECEYKYPNLINTERVVKIIEIYSKYVKICKYYYLIMDYYEDCIDLFEFLQNKPVKEDYLKKIIKEMALSIKDCHDNGIVHLDIKCENFIVVNRDPLKLVLIDFGASHMIGESLERIVGTRMYLAPEIRDNKQFHFVSDIWSLGAVLYYIYTNKDRLRLEKTNCNEIINEMDCSQTMKSLLNGMLCVDCNTRFTVDEVLNHEWLC